MAYLALIAAAEGRRAGIAAVAGVALGLAIVGLAAALGLAALLEASPFAYRALRWAGAAYLLWLAWEAWAGAGEVSPGRAHAPADTIRHFRRGLVTNLLNPKAALFFIAVFPGFIDRTAPVAAQTAMLLAVYLAIATAIHLMLVFGASRAGRQLADPVRRSFARRVFAILLAAVAGWFLLG